MGHTADLTVIEVDVETLAVVPVQRRYTRVDSHRWQVASDALDTVDEFEVDQHGLVLDQVGAFRRTL